MYHTSAVTNEKRYFRSAYHQKQYVIPPSDTAPAGRCRGESPREAAETLRFAQGDIPRLSSNLGTIHILMNKLWVKSSYIQLKP